METKTPIGDLQTLYDEAFDRYGARALWSYRRLTIPTPGQAAVIGRALRVAGDMAARRLAERLEQACRAPLF